MDAKETAEFVHNIKPKMVILTHYNTNVIVMQSLEDILMKIFG